jgi:hypothetical protein
MWQPRRVELLDSEDDDKYSPSNGWEYVSNDTLARPRRLESLANIV